MDRKGFLTSSASIAALAGLGAVTGTQAAGKSAFKLKYAPNLGLFDNIPDEIDRLDEFAAHGFKAFEFNGLLGWDFKRAEALRVRRDKLGLEMGVFVANPDGWDKAGMVDPEQHPAFLDQVRKSVDYYKIMGNQCCTVITGMNMGDRVPRGQQRANVVDALRKAAEIVEPVGLTLVLEPLNNQVNHPNYFISRSDESYEVMKAVDSPNIKILFDIYHQQITEGNLINNIRRFYDEIGYFQVADVPGRHEPGSGEINYRNVFKAIYELGYKGILGLELSPSIDEEPAGSMRVVNGVIEADKFEV